jgi:hypothetical protein
MPNPEQGAGWEQEQIELLKPDRIINFVTGEILWDENQEAIDNALFSIEDIYKRVKKLYVGVGNIGLIGVGVSFALDVKEVIAATCIGVTLSGYGMGYLPDFIDKINNKINN